MDHGEGVPEVANSPEPPSSHLAELLPRAFFTREDCELVDKYKVSTRWSDVPNGDQDAYADLRERLKTLALFVQTQTSPRVPMAAHASMRNVRSYAAKDMWCCIFPEAAPNKSYALQVAFIVSSRGAELCFCLGSGSAMERVEAHRTAEPSCIRGASNQDWCTW